MPFGDKIKELRGKQGLLFIPLYIFYKCLKNIIPIDKSSPTDDNFSPTDPTDSHRFMIYPENGVIEYLKWL